MDPQYPTLGEDALHDLQLARARLEAEAPDGAAADPFEAAAAPAGAA
jgi:hypothetical protein